MVRFRTYLGLSFMATLVVVYHAFSSRGQFYPAMVYLSTSKISLVLLLNMGLVFMCMLWQLTKHLFLGSLREVEIERLNEQSRRELMEILFAITIFRQEFSVSFLAMVTVLLLIKALHWLAQKRVEYIETTPSVPMLSHIRIVSFLGFLLVLDSLFLYSSLRTVIPWKASAYVFFAFEYMILATTTVSTFMKYVFYVSDMLMEGQWERKPVYTFYLELIHDLLHLSMYLCFFSVIFVYYGLPLHLIRELYETVRNFKIRVADYIRYRKITSNMNDRFPDATTEEINQSDATCIICREEMTTAKKLICGHLFHVHCLRSWLERQHTCPTCRALVVPPEGTSAVVGHRGLQSDANQQGTGISNVTEQGSTSGGMAGDNVSQHQARLQAAATAASIYGRSYVYPTPSMLVWKYSFRKDNILNVSSRIHSVRLLFKDAQDKKVLPISRSPGYAAVPQIQRPLPETSNTQLCGEDFTSPGGGHAPSYIPQLPRCFFVPYQPSGAPIDSGVGLSDDPVVAYTQLEVQRRFLEHEKEMLQNQLQLLQKKKTEEKMSVGRPTSTDNEGKRVAESSSSTSERN